LVSISILIEGFVFVLPYCTFSMTIAFHFLLFLTSKELLRSVAWPEEWGFGLKHAPIQITLVYYKKMNATLEQVETFVCYSTEIHVHSEQKRRDDHTAVATTGCDDLGISLQPFDAITLKPGSHAA
jgi:hypothetical protein